MRRHKKRINLWLYINIVPVVSYVTRIFTRFFIGSLNPAEEQQSFYALVFLLPFRTERKESNEMVSENVR